jgi:hypothetical protein
LWTQIRAPDSAGADKLVSTLGTGDAVMTKINTELKKEGLEEATGVSAPVKAVSSNSLPMALTSPWTLVLVMHLYSLVFTSLLGNP